MNIFFSVGEPSGDQHAAALIGELRRRRPGIELSGFGGPLMAEAGCRLLYRLTDLAVMGFVRVVPLLARFYRLVKRAERYFAETPPDAVVLVDFPGFNWGIARKARAAGIPVIYYLPPQLWAWAPWRIRKVRRDIDHVLCGLPFEQDWYSRRGVSCEYVGHPFFDEVSGRRLDESFVDECRRGPGPVVGLLPGSRSHEVTLNWPVLAGVAEQLGRRHPGTRFLVAAFDDLQHDLCRSAAAGTSIPFEFHVGRTSEIIEAADACLMVSGSVSLEMLARATPAVVVYRARRSMSTICSVMVTCRFMSLPNLFADEELLPEFPFAGNPARTVERITGIFDRWLADPESRQQLRDRLDDLYNSVVTHGASAKTAEAILGRLETSTARRAA